jgi:hypothetical protein
MAGIATTLRIRQAADEADAALARLRALLQSSCPGPHRIGFNDGHRWHSWCPACGYRPDGRPARQGADAGASPAGPDIK